MRFFYAKSLILFGLICGGSSIQAQTPQTLTIQPGWEDGKDASFALEPMHAGQNGNDENFICNAWTSGGSNLTQRSVIQFSLTSIPVNATITSAQLYLYGNPTSGHTQRHSWFPGTGWNINNAKLYRVTSPWSENTVVWANQPTTTNQNAVSIAPSTSQLQDYVINVTQLVQDMVVNPATSHGFMIKLDDESTYRSLIFASSDHPTAAIRPKLVVQYNVPQSVATTEQPGLISLSPNPATQTVNIRLAGAFATASDIILTDAFGKVVRTTAAKGDAASIELGNLAKGIYNVQVAANTGERYTERLVIQ